MALTCPFPTDGYPRGLYWWEKMGRSSWLMTQQIICYPASRPSWASRLTSLLIISFKRHKWAQNKIEDNCGVSTTIIFFQFFRSVLNKKKYFLCECWSQITENSSFWLSSPVPLERYVLPSFASSRSGPWGRVRFLLQFLAKPASSSNSIALGFIVK